MNIRGYLAYWERLVAEGKAVEVKHGHTSHFERTELGRKTELEDTFKIPPGKTVDDVFREMGERYASQVEKTDPALAERIRSRQRARALARAAASPKPESPGTPAPPAAAEEAPDPHNKGRRRARILI